MKHKYPKIIRYTVGLIFPEVRGAEVFENEDGCEGFHDFDNSLFYSMFEHETVTLENGDKMVVSTPKPFTINDGPL